MHVPFGIRVPQTISVCIHSTNEWRPPSIILERRGGSWLSSNLELGSVYCVLGTWPTKSPENIRLCSVSVILFCEGGKLIFLRSRLCILCRCHRPNCSVPALVNNWRYAFSVCFLFLVSKCQFRAFRHWSWYRIAQYGSASVQV